MLTLQDCIDMCELPDEVVQAIAIHEHVPCILAAELGNCLVCTETGQGRIRAMLTDEIVHAETLRDGHRLHQLEMALTHFDATHPEAVRNRRQRDRRRDS